MSTTLSQETMMDLMAYADGELDGADKEKVEKLLLSDEDAVKFVEQIGGLGDFVKMIEATRDAKTVETFDIADKVMAGLEKPEPKVVGIESARKKKTSRAMGAAVVLTALAVAASVFFLARPKETPLSQQPVAVAVAKQQPKPEKQDSTGVEVEQTGADVKVFYMPGANELTTSVVVWVDESAEKKR